MTAGPPACPARVSVVIASRLGPPFVDRCLRALAPQVEASGAEVVVAVGAERAEGDRLRGEFPWARVLQCRPGTSIPALRRRGVEASHAEVVALAEERCVPERGWLSAVERGYAEIDAGVIGGPVSDAGYARVRDWAVYFCEYSAYLPGRRPGGEADLATANAAYGRRLLVDRGDLLSQGYWELVLHPVLRGEGVRFQFRPEMVVRKQGGFEVGPYLRQRFWFSRAFAAVRARADQGWRWRHVAGAPVLPFVLLVRIARRVIRSGRNRGRFLLACPLVFVALAVLAAGEWVGCVSGPGDALARVE